MKWIYSKKISHGRKFCQYTDVANKNSLKLGNFAWVNLLQSNTNILSMIQVLGKEKRMQTIRQKYSCTFFSLLCSQISVSFIFTVRYTLLEFTRWANRQHRIWGNACNTWAKSSNMISAIQCPMIPVVLDTGIPVVLFFIWPCSSMGSDH